MRHTLLRLAAPLLVGGVLLASACSSGNSNGGSAYTGPVSLDQFCASYAFNACNAVEGCCSAAGYTVDDAACHAYALRICQDQIASNQAKGRVYDPAAGGVCVNSFSVLYDGCYARPKDDPAVKAANDACNKMWVGAAALGAACTSSTDCAPVPQGQVDCLYVSGTSGGKCTARAKVGETCGSSGTGTPYVNCVDGLLCKYQTGSSPAKYSCVARATAGQACDPADSRSCIDGLACDATAKTCGSPPPAGSKCAGYGPSACAAPAFCDTKTSTCTAPGSTGAACVAYSVPSQCASGLSCDPTSKICVALKVDGDACTSSTQCASGYCSSSKCGRQTIATPGTCGAFGTKTGG